MKKLFVFLCLLGFLLLNNPVNAEEEIILFYSNTCPFCHDVLEVIEEYELDETLNLLKLEAGEENFTEIYHEHLEICGVPVHQGGYPTIYYNQECSFGKTNNINLLFRLAGIEEVKGEVDPKINDGNEVEEDKEKGNEEERALGETLSVIEDEPMPIWLMISVFIGPAIFIYIAYLIIKKLNL